MTVPVYVAIPVYNGARTIHQTLSNVLNQTYKDFQILVYDDGSTDRTAQIVGQLIAKDSRVTLLNGDQNVGRGAARNRLLEAAQDGIIAWQDADDSWNPSKLETQLAFFESFEGQGINPATSVMISTFNRAVTRNDKEFVTKHTPPESYDAAYVFSEAYNKCPFQLQATFGLASVYLNAGGFDENLNWSEDFDIALRILTHGSRIISHPAERALATYHHSLAGAKGDSVEKSQKVLRDRHREFARASGVDIDELFTKRQLNYLFNIYLNNKNYIKALSITMAPFIEAGDEKAHLMSRNILAVIRSLVQEGLAEKAQGALARAAQDDGEE
ncbi:MAG: glycosyltransferase [Caulobacteraceae bacterium]|nr:glycosyltransferase [Caulobacteraceae bacterium]